MDWGSTLSSLGKGGRRGGGRGKKGQEETPAGSQGPQRSSTLLSLTPFPVGPRPDVTLRVLLSTDPWLGKVRAFWGSAAKDGGEELLLLCSLPPKCSSPGKSSPGGPPPSPGSPRPSSASWGRAFKLTPIMQGTLQAPGLEQSRVIFLLKSKT